MVNNPGISISLTNNCNEPINLIGNTSGVGNSLPAGDGVGMALINGALQIENSKGETICVYEMTSLGGLVFVSGTGCSMTLGASNVTSTSCPPCPNINNLNSCITTCVITVNTCECPDDATLDLNGNCVCNDPNMVFINGACGSCPKGTSDTNGICCAQGQINANGICCAAGQINDNGICCAAGQINDNGICCAAGQINANGICCAQGAINVGGVCANPCYQGVSKSTTNYCLASESCCSAMGNGETFYGCSGSNVQGCCFNVCPEGQIALDCICCQQGQLNIGGICCNPGTITNGVSCCPEGQTSVDGICCAPEQVNVNGVCCDSALQYGDPCSRHSSCCSNNTMCTVSGTADSGICCQQGETICNGGCGMGC